MFSEILMVRKCVELVMSMFKMENNGVMIRIWMCGHSVNKYVYLLLMTLKHYFGSKVPAHVEFIIAVGDRL